MVKISNKDEDLEVINEPSKKKKEKREKKKKKKEATKRDKDEKFEKSLSIEEEPPKKKRKKDKKKKKEKKKGGKNEADGSNNDTKENPLPDGETRKHKAEQTDKKIILSSALDYVPTGKDKEENDVSLLLFYQYVEPPWDNEFYNNTVLSHMQKLGEDLHLTGRMRVAREGLNCTLTSSHENILGFCKELRKFHKGEFVDTEFKVTTDLPKKQRFPNLKVMPVTELVNYGLNGEKAPPIDYTGTHLEPKSYHEKLAEDNTVVIDVRNHYEAAIGRFDPPQTGAEYMDPLMRKSTEFPVWLDKPETKEKLKGKQVLMYCTGGVRCERASALLKYKIDTDPGIKDLGIKGVYQLQGGVDKYFKQFPEGGFWKGKNYTFDKRFAHAPPQVEGDERSGKSEPDVMGKCEVCRKPWDMYRGKRRCPTCGVPSLICRDCFQADKDGIRKIDRRIRCDLCVEQNVKSKAQLKVQEQKELEEYQSKQIASGIIPDSTGDKKRSKNSHKFGPAPNPDNVTRLFVKNMCSKNMDEATLLDAIPGITHIVWRTDRTSGQFFGQGWIEMATPEDAARAVGMNGKRVLNRPIYIEYQPPGGKDAWPPPSSRIGQSGS
mmetsp:Transcript_31254/g.47908  ORF Transcript_31254/g.47908 Transcript_31254/m.47908 type:complete len:604 (-) Transcript_31254:63-1874(-)